MYYETIKCKRVYYLTTIMEIYEQHYPSYYKGEGSCKGRMRDF